VNKRIPYLWFLAILGIAVGMISWGSALQAQEAPSASTQTSPQSSPSSPDSTPAAMPETPPGTQQKPSAQSPQTPDSSAPDAGSKSASPNSSSPNDTDTQTFLGTVQKQGDKFVLKEDSGKTYDIDHQADVAKFEGKRVRVQGTLDSSGTKILVK
jgi:hypothetical protein